VTRGRRERREGMLRIGDVMKEQGRRQDWLAGRLGISQSMLSLMLRGRRYWSEERKRLAIEALGVEGDDGLFEPIEGQECPLCRGGGLVETPSETMYCRFCLGLGQVTQERLEDVLGAEFVPEGMV